MTRITEATPKEARAYFLKGSSYFNGELPKYLSFEKILNGVSNVLDGKPYDTYKKFKPSDLPSVNYHFITNKDGRYSWRPFELIHPAIYVSMVDRICDPENWDLIIKRMKSFQNGVVECRSIPVISINAESDKAAQIQSWWHEIEQYSLELSLQYSHLLHTDVADCYGSLYTHSISWSLHGKDTAKKHKELTLIGNEIDSHIRAGRYGQTNGIAQGSVLMDFIAELVLGYVDQKIADHISGEHDYHILRYRDDYRIFANSDQRADQVLRVVSDQLREVGMRLNVSKTLTSTNVITGSIKPDKLAGIDLQDLGSANAKTIQKQLLRLHSFGSRFPNSGALQRLVGDFYEHMTDRIEPSDELAAQVAICTDIAVVSPRTIPAVAGILSKLLSVAPPDKKQNLWQRVLGKMKRVPHNGHQEIWLQRVIKPKEVNIPFKSDEKICQIVNGEHDIFLWNSCWIKDKALKHEINNSNIVVSDPTESPEVIQHDELELFTARTWMY